MALAHDWLVGYRGGEAVLDAIVRALEPWCDLAGLLVMFDDGRPLTPTIDRLKKRASFLNAVPGGRSLRRWLLPAYPQAVASLSAELAAWHDREPIDLLVSTSSAAIKGLRPPRGVAHLCYCHSPARYLWSQGEEYARGRAGALRAFGLGCFGPWLRSWDRRSAANVTHFLANSTHTRNLIERAYARASRVLFPPVRTDFFTPPTSPTVRRGWLFVGALEPYKRVDLAIAAARHAGADLVIVGDGSLRDDVRRECARSDRSGPSVRATGRISDDELRELYRTREVLIFPQVEDFGIVGGEALACGLPIAARRAGGALDLVDADRSGAFIEEPATPESVARAAQRAAAIGQADLCRASAERFGPEEFHRGIVECVRTILAGGTPS